MASLGPWTTRTIVVVAVVVVVVVVSEEFRLAATQEEFAAKCRSLVAAGIAGSRRQAAQALADGYRRCKAESSSVERKTRWDRL